MSQIASSLRLRTSFHDTLLDEWPAGRGVALGAGRLSNPGLPPLEMDPSFARWAEASSPDQTPVEPGVPDRPAGRSLLCTLSLTLASLALPAAMFAWFNLRDPGAVRSALPGAVCSAPPSPAPGSSLLSQPGARDRGEAPTNKIGAVANSRPAEHAAALRPGGGPLAHHEDAVGSKKTTRAISRATPTRTLAPQGVREADPAPVLQQAQIAFAQGDHEGAVAMALRETMRGGSTPETNTAWRFLATAACRTGDASLATRAYAHLSDGDRQFMTGVCQREGLVFKIR